MSPCGRLGTDYRFKGYANCAGTWNKSPFFDAYEFPFTGLIRERNWCGSDGMVHVRTVKEPKQSIPTFKETLDLLMKVSATITDTFTHSLTNCAPHEQPENLHVKFNIDVKVYNEPERVFSLMNEIIVSHPEWEVKLAPRIILGLWHPRFLSAAKVHLPYCKRSHIGPAPDIARKYFWNDCDAFSMWFPALATADGEKSVFLDLGAGGGPLTIMSDSDMNAKRPGRSSWFGR
jgi:hypothetical protein